MIIETDKIGEDGARTVLTMRPKREYIVGRGETLNVIFFGADAGAKCAGDDRVLNMAGAEKHTCRIILDGKGARATLFAFIVGKGALKFELEATAAHVKGGTFSEIRVKAALYDNSRLDFRGGLKIEKRAQLSETFLSTHSLLMNNGAAARTIPSLEILADDVKAGHAATLGKVSAEEMFYLQSRGINQREAENMLVLGFFEEQLQRISDIDLRDSLRQAIIRSLPF